MKKMYLNSVMKMLPPLIVGAFLCVATNLSAQTITPVGAEFHGEWTFDKAQAQERPLNSKENFTPRAVTKDDFTTFNYFYTMPTEINFMAGNEAFVVCYSDARYVLAAFNAEFENSIEFLDPQPIEDEEGNHIYVTSMPRFFNLTLNGNTMTMQSSYVYRGGQNQDKYTEGMITIYHKK